MATQYSPLGHTVCQKQACAVFFALFAVAAIVSLFTVMIVNSGDPEPLPNSLFLNRTIIPSSSSSSSTAQSFSSSSTGPISPSNTAPSSSSSSNCTLNSQCPPLFVCFQNVCTPPGYDVLLVAGQSNAAGLSSGVYQNYNPFVDVANPRIKQLNLCSVNPGSTTTVIPSGAQMYSPSCYALSGRIGFTLVASVNILPSIAPNRQILVINGAVGGTSFSGGNWNPGNAVFNQFVALAQINNSNYVMCDQCKNRLSPVMFWHQGENDAINGVSQSQYTSYFITMYQAFTNLIPGFSNQTKIALGGLLPAFVQSQSSYNPVQQAIQNMSSNLIQASFVNSSGLTGANPHFDSPSYRILGQRYAQVYLVNDQLTSLFVPFGNTNFSSPCFVNPFICQNGGLCNSFNISLSPYYTCVCPVGFTGLNCSVNVNFCGGNPCAIGINPGAIGCTNYPGPVVNYTCTCAQNYSTPGFNSGCYTSFISYWNTANTNSGSSQSNQIALPLVTNGAYNIIVNWGDGNSSLIIDPTQNLHTYAQPGLYVITIAGVIQGFGFNNAGDVLKLLKIMQYGSILLGTDGSFPYFSPGNLGGYFYGCSNLQINATDSLNLNGVTLFTNMFSQCSSLAIIPGIESWNTSLITNMATMFNGAALFNQNLNLWNTSSVTTMYAMFANCPNFNQPLGQWNTASATSMQQMFQAATTFNQSINTWIVSSVAGMNGMFNNAKAFNQSLSNWNISSVTDIGSMFSGATVFNQDITTWNTSSVVNMQQTFNSATAFNQAIGNWQTGRVTSMYAMFANCPNFNQPLGQWNTAAATSMQQMFQSAPVFNQNITNWIVSSVTTMNSMFQNAFAFNQAVSNWNPVSVTDMGNLFNGATAFNQPLTGWTTPKLVNAAGMFQNAFVFNQPLANLNMASVTTMALMLASAHSFNQAIGNWNTGSSTSMNAVFDNAFSFNQPLSTWNVSFVTNMNNMFANAPFNQNISNWDVRRVTNMVTMFTGSLSTTNYNSLLTSWYSEDSLTPGLTKSITLNVGSTQRWCNNTGYLGLTGTDLWTITDGGCI